jgi:hypothetical protein
MKYSWAISHGNMELVSNISETVSIFLIRGVASTRNIYTKEYALSCPNSVLWDKVLCSLTIQRIDDSYYNYCYIVVENYYITVEEIIFLGFDSKIDYSLDSQFL